MKKLYNLCKQYGIEITMTNAEYDDSVSFKFYDRKTHTYFCQIVTDEMMDSLNVSFEDALCDKVIEALKLDKDPWSRRESVYVLQTCKRCDGRGSLVNLSCNSFITCPECNGEGKIKIGYR